LSHQALTPHPVARTAAALAPHGFYILIAAALVGALGMTLPAGPGGLVALVVAGTLTALFVLLRVFARRQTRQDETLHSQLAEFIACDAAPSFTTDSYGEVKYQNRAAVERFGTRGGQTLTRSLSEIFANPGAVLHRLQNRAEATGAAREDVVTRRGHVRLAVHRIGEAGFLWRLEDMAERATGGRGAESISLPMLTVSRSDTVLYMNEAMRRLVGERVRSLDRIFADLPLRPGEEHDILTADGPTRALVAALETTAGRREVFLLPAPGVARGENPRDLEALPVALVRVTAAGILAEANRMARALLGQATIGAPFSEALEGLGRPVQDWLDDALAGRAERRPEVLRVLPACHPVAGDRGRPARSGRGADRCDPAQDARGAVRAKPEDAGDRPACRRHRP
jgi:two-component system cell cycle sensor histidine kinase/response regulator CckA